MYFQIQVSCVPSGILLSLSCFFQGGRQVLPTKTSGLARDAGQVRQSANVPFLVLWGGFRYPVVTVSANVYFVLSKHRLSFLGTCKADGLQLVGVIAYVLCKASFDFAVVVLVVKSQ